MPASGYTIFKGVGSKQPVIMRQFSFSSIVTWFSWVDVCLTGHAHSGANKQSAMPVVRRISCCVSPTFILTFWQCCCLEAWPNWAVLEERDTKKRLRDLSSYPVLGIFKC